MKNAFLSLIVILYSTVVFAQEPVDYVNPFIGTENSIRPSIWEANGGTYPGAVLPFGMVQVTPDNYHFNTLFIKNFSLLNHTSGYPYGSSGDFHIMPFSGEFESIKSTGSSFQHKNEIAKPGYYSVFLDKHSVKAEMTATEHSGFFRYSFLEKKSNGIVIYGIKEVKADEKGRLMGKCGGYYFVLELNCVGAEINIDETKVVLQLHNSTKEILVKIGFSLTSADNAEKNLDSEIKGWEFEQVKLAAHKIWNKKLRKVIVETNNETNKELFYTALYHTYLAPSITSDHGSPKRYAGLSPWDTYKCKQPLLTLLNPVIQSDMIKSVLEQYKKDGVMDPGPMTGVHNVPILLDSYVKGIDMDITSVYEAMTASLLKPPFGRRDIKSFFEGNYVPAEKSYSVTKTMEYSYNFWAMAQMAKELGKTSDYDLLIEKSQYFKNSYNPDTKFMTAKSLSGDWERGGYREGDKWSYNWTSTHDIQSLINLAGGKNEFIKQLDSCFQTGKYFHDNEPPLHNAYLYSYAGHPWKTQEVVRNIMELDYSAKPGGISGNDDLGALSAWYVFSSLGFFPVCPGRPEYIIGSPLFEKVTIYSDKGEPFIIKSNNVSKKNKYIQSIRLNDKVYKNLWLSHHDLISGGTLEIEMGDKPLIAEINRENLPLSETKTKPDFSIKKWELSKTTAGANEPFGIVASIQNNGTCTGSVSLTVLVNEKVVETKWFLIDGNVTTSKTVSLRLYEPGNYIIGINGESTQNIEIVADKKAEFSYENLNLPSPPIANINGAVVFKTRIKNIGSFSGTKNINLFINGNVVDSFALQLKPGESKEIKFENTFLQEGLYEIKIEKTEAEKLLIYGPELFEKAIYNKSIKPIMAFDFNTPNVGSIEDFSDLKNNAIVHGDVEWVNGIFGKAIKTNAYKNAYVEIPEHNEYGKIADGKIMTIMLWIYPMDEKNFSDIISKGDLNVIQVRASNTEVNYYSGGYQRGEAYTLLPKDWNRNWHHLVGVSNGKSLKLYIDGKLMVEKLLGKDMNFASTTGHPWNIGRNAANTDRAYNGYIDQLMIFDKALSDTEIKEFMLFIKD